MSEKTPQQQLDDVLKLYLDNVNKTGRRDGALELEVRFGTKGIHRITHIDYDNVVRRLLSLGFNRTPAEYFLRIFNEYVDPKTGVTKMSNIRSEIQGISRISQYCKTDSPTDNYGSAIVTFEQKSYFRTGDQTQYPIDFDDFNFRVSLNQEKSLSSGSGLARGTLEKWNDTKKTFRYVSRCSLRSPDYPIRVDVSVVKSSKRRGRSLVPEYRFKDSGVLEATQYYEIEIEVDNTQVGLGTRFSTPEQLGAALRKVIKFVLSGIQSTNYPVSYPEQEGVLSDYMKLLWGKEEESDRRRRVYPKNFVGPSSYTLQMQNIAPVNEDAVIPNIRNDYTVTDKADGERKLLYIAEGGKIYMIDTNMNVQFSGAKTPKSELFDTLIDGEHILHNKEGEFINLYAAFDVYYVKGKDMRGLHFAPIGEGADEASRSAFRLPILTSVVKSMEATSIVRDTISPVRIEVKTFYSSSASQSIFQACDFVLRKVRDGLFEYETDGLIFTPANMAVGASSPEASPPKPIKVTWEHSFKWKPPEFNTIDFLVTMKKNADGSEFIGNVFQGGVDTSAATQLTQYKTAILRVGFDERKHGYQNPCLNVIEDDIPSFGNKDDEEGYRPLQFFPSNPADFDAGICNLLLRPGAADDKVMLTEEGQVIEDNTIVEFRYDMEKEGAWRWVPLRVRHDKTADLRGGGKNYGNAYHVANSNWHSIHNPISAEMISSGVGIPDELADDDIYYNRVTGSTGTRGLRNFHNLFVKKMLITSVSRRGDTLIDLAVGKGGDFSKWIQARLKFVFGVDIARDNIENRIDGACARYLNYRKEFRTVPRCLFVVGNSSVNVRNTDAIVTEKGKQITQAVFGRGAKDAKALGQGVYKAYGVGEDGFDVCSIQFAIHYMFESQVTLQNFLRNVSETTKVGGYFIGTSYDGSSIFKMLASKKEGESVTITEDGAKIWEVTKRYDREEFEADSSSLGYAIDVYQDSINKVFREYLVNYDYLTRLMENYGFVLLSRDEYVEKGLPASTGLFSELYGAMMNEIKRNKRAKNEYGEAGNMSAGERTISFLNRYFVYKKVRAVDAEKVAQGLLGQSQEEVRDLDEESRVAQEEAKKVLKKAAPKRTTRKLRKKLVLKPDKSDADK